MSSLFVFFFCWALRNICLCVCRRSRIYLIRSGRCGRTGARVPERATVALRIRRACASTKSEDVPAVTSVIKFAICRYKDVFFFPLVHTMKDFIFTSFDNFIISLDWAEWYVKLFFLLSFPVWMKCVQKWLRLKYVRCRGTYELQLISLWMTA